ncbi:MAG: hypothetical protein KAV82_05605 [Phycisphaerae bacterium]|nr:hypothetical protein [Phycisphaerae bacterium]
MDKWEIARTTGVCSISGQPLEEGDEYYVVLFEDGESFRRLDYSTDAWTGPPDGAFCYFKSKIQPKKQKKRLFVDDDLLINFFLRLTDETDESRLRFRFVLGLILMRKRLLRYEQTVWEQELECWQMRLTKDRTLHQVVNPHLTDDQIEGVSRQLGGILHGDMGDFADETDETDEGDEVVEQPTTDEEEGNDA